MEVECVGVIGRPCRFSADQLEVEGNGDLAGYLVLQREQILGIMVETLGPDMQAGLGIDQLGIDPDSLARAADAALQHIAHAELAADLANIERLLPIGQRRDARDHNR